MLSFRVKISNVWHVVNPIFNDFKIKRSRDKEQIFQIRTFADGVLTFFCPDYSLLLAFAGETLELEITETICTNTKVYNAILKVAPEINVFLKKITATVTIIDEYYSIFDKVLQSLEFDEDLNVQTAVPSSIQVLDLQNEIVPSRTWDLNTLIQFLFNQINAKLLFEWAFYGVSQTPALELDLKNLVITNENNIKFINDTKVTEQKFTISLKTLLDLLLQKYFLGWYLVENTGTIPNLPISQFTHFVQFKKINSTVGFTNFITINEDKSEQTYTILSDYDFSILSVKTFDFDATNTDINQSIFATVNVKFDVEKNNKKEVPLNCEVYLPKIQQAETNKIIMFDCFFNNQSINLKTYQNQLYNDSVRPFDYAEGDCDEVTLQGVGSLSRIFYELPENLVRTGTIAFYINLTAGLGTNLIYLCYGNQNGAYTKTKINTGYNIINYSSQGGEYWLESSTTAVYVVKFILINYAVTNNTRYGVYAFNSYIGTYNLLYNFGANLPKRQAIYKIGNINETITVNEAKKEQQTVLYDYKNTINNLNFWHKVQTSLTGRGLWFTIYEVERTYTNDYFSQVKLTLNR